MLARRWAFDAGAVNFPASAIKSEGNVMPRAIITKEALLKIVNKEMERLPACRNLHIQSIISDPKRTHGANWTTYGIQRSGPDNDEVECQEAIAAFMADLQTRYDIAE